MTCLFTEVARNDVTNILAETELQFGSRQRARYAALIDHAAAMIAEKPERASIRPDMDFLPGLRAFHIALAAGRRAAASHLLYYIVGPSTGTAVVLRVLHEKMEPARHVASGLP